MDLSKYLDLYLQTSREYLKILNDALLKLEKNPGDKTAIEEIFRNAHSLKGQSAAMEFSNIAYLCHAIEDAFFEIKEKKLKLTSSIADELFRCFDVLNESLDAIEKSEKEPDLPSRIDALKKITGVNTEGIGKSDHSKTSTEPLNKTKKPETQNTPKNTETNTDQIQKPTTQDSSLKIHDINTINVKIEFLDETMNILEELLVERLKLKKFLKGQDNPVLKNYFDTSQKLIDALQYQVVQMRAMPLSLVFDHFPRAVRDLAREENKQVELKIEGSDLELDRTIVNRLDEPLTHIIRNAVSHGIQKQGIITISAKREKDFATIMVSDNGMGIDWEEISKKSSASSKNKNLKDLLFSGISTSEHVTQISGRGVGLKAVKKMVEDFGGNIDVKSEKGKGTVFIIKLPLTLAIAKALLVKINHKDYAIPSITIDRILKIPSPSIKKMAGEEFFILEKNKIPLLRMNKVLPGLSTKNQEANIFQETQKPDNDDLLAVVFESKEDKTALVIDQVLETTDIVIKPVPKILKNIRQLGGVTILNDGKAALILNPQEIL